MTSGLFTAVFTHLLKRVSVLRGVQLLCCKRLKHTSLGNEGEVYYTYQTPDGIPACDNIEVFKNILEG